MSLALHGHHVLLIATITFITAILTPNWYSNSEKRINLNIFQICTNSSSPQPCSWIFSSHLPGSLLETIKMAYPILVASFAFACVSLSVTGLVLGSWLIERRAHDNRSTLLLVFIMLATFLSLLFSCGVWVTMLTTNSQQDVFNISDIRLKDFGFSFWINIGSSGVYLYALFIYLFMICKN
ncbi:unnamed protein product [Rotaria magnacalcarata]|uniref:Uncharacterized protein n=1 Tax=Rotaria magnacalcarata TaxID=392030 RepID=A0A816PK39_9BILA|nr:unnamed protein product [Rotaria magnacalcarata]CAF1634625.1 unnamed protein product [Rotaria magnacalcarata]CAF1927091.1 unnamed protein product [Rotaria magnacalcarata]CAF2018060.1 unnamed protein product [Rotaria magnacalcarata]CAF2049785.1 unnamed protein product [Rotaria magnacalcarata]